MEYIQGLLNLVQDYWILSICVGFLSAFVESFIPMLPLVAIVTANAALFGMLNGFLISWIGSVAGTICLFLIVLKIGENSKLLERVKNEKVKKAILWIDQKGFKLLFIAYACPFLPACVITIASGISKRNITTFTSAVLSGKFIMFLVVSYIGQDIYGFITSPVKIIAFCLIVFIAWKLGNKLNKDLEYIEEKRHTKTEDKDLNNEEYHEEYIEMQKKVR
ncbi:MAG: TVP38/TMEM64 family protein [Intestinibacter sp.]